MMSTLSFDEQGSVLPLTAGLMLIGFTVLALVTEIALLGAAYRDVATVADIAAEAGGAVIAEAHAYGAGIDLQAGAAQAEAVRVAEQWGDGDASVSVRIADRSICVTVSDAYRPFAGSMLGISRIPISVTSCAEPVRG